MTGLAERGCLNASEQFPSSIAALAVAFVRPLWLLFVRLALENKKAGGSLAIQF